ncbi:Uncharacterised protein [Salmonella enterica subsp. enterica serovar Typhi]|nr:Uncharacterised protein [Salmonella enterica subsp. enterica serovar Typhi]
MPSILTIWRLWLEQAEEQIKASSATISNNVSLKQPPVAAVLHGFQTLPFRFFLLSEDSHRGQ